ncbi:N-formylglutamate amidohydrolase [Paracrocinitomix mangrovi]|uniref:N-formylglutamate amidohydrolase n=1 Tax=Paracrocinitomix mangrovi TaxID=2862509 RepID=UPI001C8E62CD|nr:N-formylglutamate amidohydrolase [Paracrocinitomix mangrovi]UKN02131.1 N-formylglutamate amidohydrolase [Paracrocinitomix mangrovi]
MNHPYFIREAKAPLVPVILSIPHCGTSFPDEIVDQYLTDQVNSIDDTDWYLQDLYDFVAEMGITTVYAKYSRWVIDLNRDPESAPLYNDGRIITGLTTTTDFLGNPIYKEGNEPDQTEIERRLNLYYWPYYQQIQELLDERIQQFGKVLLWDAHSIREKVPTIRKDPFPQMILGDNDQTSADQKLIDKTLENLSSKYQVNHNDPFKGGHITRYFGNPSKNVNALQLERNKNLYMDDSERNFELSKANQMRELLKKNFQDLIDLL